MKLFDLSGKTAFVSGASRGIGMAWDCRRLPPTPRPKERSDR